MSSDNENRKWNIADIGRAIGNSAVAIAKGQFILRLGLDKYFMQIAWTFFLITLIILFGLGVDISLARVEKNNKLLHELEIEYTQKSYELMSLQRRSVVEVHLVDCGSKVGEPAVKAEIIK